MAKKHSPKIGGTPGDGVSTKTEDAPAKVDLLTKGPDVGEASDSKGQASNDKKKTPPTTPKAKEKSIVNPEDLPSHASPPDPSSPRSSKTIVDRFLDKLSPKKEESASNPTSPAGGLQPSLMANKPNNSLSFDKEAKATTPPGKDNISETTEKTASKAEQGVLSRATDPKPGARTDKKGEPVTTPEKTVPRTPRRDAPTSPAKLPLPTSPDQDDPFIDSQSEASPKETSKASENPTVKADEEGELPTAEKTADKKNEKEPARARKVSSPKARSPQSSGRSPIVSPKALSPKNTGADKEPRETPKGKNKAVVFFEDESDRHIPSTSPSQVAKPGSDPEKPGTEKPGAGGPSGGEPLGEWNSMEKAMREAMRKALGQEDLDEASWEEETRKLALDATRYTSANRQPVFPNHDKGRLDEAREIGEEMRERARIQRLQDPGARENMDRVAQEMFAAASKGETLKPADIESDDEIESEGGDSGEARWTNWARPIKWDESGAGAGATGDDATGDDDWIEPTAAPMPPSPQTLTGAYEKLRLREREIDWLQAQLQSLAAAVAAASKETATQLEAFREGLERNVATVLDRVQRAEDNFDRQRAGFTERINNLEALPAQGARREASQSRFQVGFLIIAALAVGCFVGYDAWDNNKILGRYAGIYVNGGFNGYQTFAIFRTIGGLFLYTLSAATVGGLMTLLFTELE